MNIHGFGTLVPCPDLAGSSGLVGVNHFLDHLAADRTGFTGGEVAVVAVLEVYADFERRADSYAAINCGVQL